MTNYSEKLRDPRWQKKRLEVLERDKWECQCCFDDTNTLMVHHLRYIKGNDPWDYDDTDLITLCEECHKLYHLLVKKFDIDVVAGIVHIYFKHECQIVAKTIDRT